MTPPVLWTSGIDLETCFLKEVSFGIVDSIPTEISLYTATRVKPRLKPFFLTGFEQGLKASESYF